MLDENVTSRNATPRNAAFAALNLVPRDGESGDRLGRQLAASETALAVPEADLERIAFNLWNEGRVDEAVELLERAIAAERHRKHRPARDAAAGLPAIGRNESADTLVEPISDWRERHRAALSPADFNAFGASVPTIDITPAAADAIAPPPPPRRSARPALIIGLCLAATVGLAAGASLWNGLDGNAGGPAAAPTARLEPATIVPAASTAEPEAEIAIAEPEAELAAVPPPEEELALEDAVSPPAIYTPPSAEAPAESVAAADQAGGDTAEPTLATMAPETTASINPAPIAAEQPAIAEPRLPRQRPDPPAYVEELRPVPVLGAEPPPVYSRSAPPTYLPRPEPFFDPMNPPSTLTPAEHQALLERRAWAADYAAKRRFIAEQRAMAEGDLFDVTIP